MEKNKINNIQKELLKKKKFLKNEIKRLILKSIVQNQSIKPLVRIKASKVYQMKSNLTFLSKQKNNICLKTGRFKGVLNLTQLTRHTTKKLGTIGSLQNIKIKSW